MADPTDPFAWMREPVPPPPTPASHKLLRTLALAGLLLVGGSLVSQSVPALVGPIMLADG